MHELRKAATTLLLNCQTSNCYSRFTVHIVAISRSGCWLHIQGDVIFIQSYCWLEYLCILALNALLSVITECWIDLEGVSHCTRVKEKKPSSSNRLSSTGLPQPAYCLTFSDFKSSINLCGYISLACFILRSKYHQTKPYLLNQPAQECSVQCLLKWQVQTLPSVQVTAVNLWSVCWRFTTKIHF